MSSGDDECHVTLESIDEDGSFRARYAGPPSVAVCELLGAITGTRPVDLPPLYDAVDPDALNELLGRGPTATRDEDVTVELQYHGYSLRIHGHGVIEAEPVSRRRGVDRS